MKKAEEVRVRANEAACEKPGLPIARCGIGGVLMGLANLVPGVSGGTMILIMGLYDEFIGSVADVTRFQFTRRNMAFLGVVGGAAAVTVVVLAKSLAQLVIVHPLVMYSLFIGMTLGGVPLLVRMMRPVKPTAMVSLVLGIVLMVAIAATKSDTSELTKEDKARIKAEVAAGEFTVKPAYGRDIAAGILGMSAMVLPGISGAYMLLLLGRYEQVLAAIALTKEYAMSLGKSGNLDALHVLVPVAIGAILALVCVTNLIKWLLRRHEKPTVGLLLGIVLGSVVMLWQMVDPQDGVEHAKAVGVLVVGFVLTVGLSRIGGTKPVDADRGDNGGAELA